MRHPHLAIQTIVAAVDDTHAMVLGVHDPADTHLHLWVEAAEKALLAAMIPPEPIAIEKTKAPPRTAPPPEQDMQQLSERQKHFNATLMQIVHGLNTRSQTDVARSKIMAEKPVNFDTTRPSEK